MLRYKYIFKDDFLIQLDSIEFVRFTRNHPAVMEQVFHHKKISKIEQEEWYCNVYSKNENHHIWVIYDAKIMTPVGYIQLKLDSAQHQRAKTKLIMHPEFSGLGYENVILKWLINKGIEKINYPVHKLYYDILKEDISMQLSLKKSGFVQEAELKEHVQKNQQWRDILMFSITYKDD